MILGYLGWSVMYAKFLSFHGKTRDLRCNSNNLCKYLENPDLIQMVVKLSPACCGLSLTAAITIVASLNASKLSNL